MRQHRVKKYEATVYHSSTGSSSTREYAFTQVQADEIGAVLHEDGLDILSAVKLCERWSRRGKHGDIRYSYRIPISDQLAALDARNATRNQK